MKLISLENKGTFEIEFFVGTVEECLFNDFCPCIGCQDLLCVLKICVKS